MLFRAFFNSIKAYQICIPLLGYLMVRFFHSYSVCNEIKRFVCIV
jgi:hypothetical protein